MGWWQTLTSWRSAPSPAQPYAAVERWARPVTFTLNLPPEMSESGSAAGWSTARVSREFAMSVPAVKRGRDLICGTLGTLRLRKHDARRRVVDSELLDQPEPDIARSVTMTFSVEDMLFEGRAWWRILEFGPDGFPAKVRRLESSSVNVRRDGRVYVSREGQAQGQAMEWVPDAELIRIDCPNDPLLVVGARAIRAAHALDRAAARYADEPLPLGYFTPSGDVDPGDDDDIEEILDDFEDARARRVWAYVGAGLTPHVLQWNPEQLQLGKARDTAVLELSRLLGVDPEELGVSTTSRTYQNAEQRRLDLVDFTLAAYVVAIEDRLSMPDVTPPGYYCRAEYGGFLRSDTKTRMETYQVGRQVGVYDDERIAQLEDVPLQTVRNARAQGVPPAAATVPAGPAPSARPQQEESSPVDNTTSALEVRFAVDEPAVTIGFAMDSGVSEFKADAEKRTVSGLVIPWNTVAYSRGYHWMFAPGSLHWAVESRVKLDRDHEYGSELGRALTLTNGTTGLAGTFKVARGAEGDRILALAEDSVYDGFSASVTFDAEADGWTAHPDNSSIRLVHSATLRKVAITAMPAFDDARVAAVTARREQEIPAMTAPAAPAPAPPSPEPPVPAPPDLAAFTAGLTAAISTAVAETFARLPQPQQPPERQVVPAGRAVVVRESPVYLMNGHGPSLVRDSWKARTENDHEAIERLRKFAVQTRDAAEQAMVHPEFAVSTGSASQVVPPGYRPELYVTQLMQGRPLVNSVSRGTLSDATPFNIPKFGSATNASSQHVEGVNPTGGTLNLGTATVAPGAISGLFELTREIVDSANPAVDAIAMAAMQESYSQQTEALLYAELNGTNGQGGTITSGFVPSGTQAATVTGSAGGVEAGGDELLTAVRGQMALYGFRRFGRANRAHLSQEATQAFAGAKDTTGRPLLPYVGAQNSVGTANTQTEGYEIDGLLFTPTWSMIGNASGDADVLFFNSVDVWAWESPLLMFRFEERGGPARIDLALFGYFATRILRPVGLSAIRYTVTP